MKRSIWLLLFCLVFIFSCDKKEEDPVIKVTYEVITGGGAEWYGEFDDENGQRINTTELGSSTLPSVWRYEFEPKISPIIVTIHGTVDCPTCTDTDRMASEDITVNIYINGKLEQTQTNQCRECTGGSIKGLATTWMRLPEELAD